MMALRIEIFSERKERLGEGPLWDPQSERLYWIDSYGPAVHRADLKGGDRKTAIAQIRIDGQRCKWRVVKDVPIAWVE